MSLPSSRADMIAWAKRKLGYPVINIEVSDDQCDDRVDEALQKFYDFHYEGTEKLYFKVLITDEIIANQYITMPDWIIGVIGIFPINTIMTMNNMFSFRYQIALNELWDLTHSSITPFYQSMQHMSLLSEILTGQQPIRYNRHINNLYLDLDWANVAAGQYLIVEAYSIVDPETHSQVYQDRWLLKYVTALIKRQWGENLSKFQDVVLPGGMRFNGDKILADAEKEINKLDAELESSYRMPAYDIIA